MTTMKSVTVLKIPAARRFFVSEIQLVCYLKDKFRYRDSFLAISVKRDRCHRWRIHTRIKN
jgi:hypothetical protein